MSKPLWQPTASLQALQARAQLYQQIRQFFASRNVLEVDTPTLSHGTVTDVHLDAFSCEFNYSSTGKTETLYLQTSPEFALKRLLATYKTCVYQLGKAYRHEGHGRWHNPEFTMLEWYRIGFDDHQLMQEVSELLQLVLDVPETEMLSYQQAFLKHLALDPLTATTAEVATVFNRCNIDLSDDYPIDHDGMLQLLFSYEIEPNVGQQVPCFIYGYPASQASLAKLNIQDPRTADRFEVYFKGAELANGFHELQSAPEQRRRFEHDNRLRATFRLPEKPIDEHFLAALDAGLPVCSGVALGVDRILMLKLGAEHIEDVIAFPVNRA